MKIKLKKGDLLLNATLLMILFLEGGCGLTRNPVPIDKMSEAKIKGMPNIRCRDFEYKPDLDQNSLTSTDCSFLAISGGGARGAFGAGFLCGWSAAGNRPNFKIVTGISTGALIAPFVFAESEYNDRLKTFYTTITTKDVIDVEGVWSFLTGESYGQNKPLVNLIAKAFDEEVLKAVAKEHAKGRRLYIGTTNLDAQQFIVWDMGAIAASGNPDALNMFRKIMLASASIPGAFPPVYFNVEVEGKKYDEMHVDGGVITEVFGYGPSLFENPAVEDKLAHACRIYVIRNGKLATEPQQVPRKGLKIAARSIDTLMKTHSWQDMYRLYFIAHRNNVEFNYVSIPDNYVFSGKEMFDEKEMKKMFDTGFEMAKSGYKWNNVPPGLRGVNDQDLIWTP